MFQIDTVTASPTLPAPAAAGAPGYFTKGNPSATPPVPATILDQDFMNMLMMELVNIVTGFGGAPSKTVYNQVFTAIQTAIATGAAGALQMANNLSDLANVATALGNLGFTLVVSVSGTYWSAYAVFPMNMGGTLKKFIIQAGYVPITGGVDGNNAVTFPTTFPTKALYGNFIGNNADNVADSAPSLNSLTTSGMNCVNTYGGNTTQLWVSMGY